MKRKIIDRDAESRGLILSLEGVFSRRSMAKQRIDADSGMTEKTMRGGGGDLSHPGGLFFGGDVLRKLEEGQGKDYLRRGKPTRREECNTRARDGTIPTHRKANMKRKRTHARELKGILSISRTQRRQKRP